MYVYTYLYSGVDFDAPSLNDLFQRGRNLPHTSIFILSVFWSRETGCLNLTAVDWARDFRRTGGSQFWSRETGRLNLTAVKLGA